MENDSSNSRCSEWLMTKSNQCPPSGNQQEIDCVGNTHLSQTDDPLLSVVEEAEKQVPNVPNSWKKQFIFYSIEC